MDSQRFDDFARLIGSGTTRRRMLRLFGGGIASGFGGLLTRRADTHAQCVNPDTCGQDLDCCEGSICDVGRLTCVESLPEPCSINGDPCSSAAGCCFGVCTDGTCQCQPEGAACNAELQCCLLDGGLTSCINGVCGVCHNDGDACTDNAECCFGECFEGTCIFCRDVGDLCDVTEQCCAGEGACIDGVCASCRDDGQDCSTNDECCFGECSEGVCTFITCQEPGFPCANADECCADLYCTDGACSTCGDYGAACDRTSDCCESTCFDGICNPCEPPGESFCNSASDCCSGTCFDAVGGPNSCAECRSPGISCSSDAECCSEQCEGGVCTPYSCNLFFYGCAFEQICVDGLCYPESWLCSSDGDCDGGEICCSRACRQADCCIDDAFPNARCADGAACVEGVCAGVDCGGSGDVCSADSDCCGAMDCVNGACQGDGTEVKTPDTPGGVTSLPDAGSGVDAGGIDTALGVSLAAGVATFLACKKLRRHPEQPEET